MKRHFLKLIVCISLLATTACTPEWYNGYEPNSPDDESPSTLEIGPCDEGDEIEIDSIPQSIIDYINANFEGVEIVSAEIFDETDELAFGIELSNGVSLLFDANGLVITSADDDEEQEISLDSLLQSIVDYVNNNFQDIQIEDAEIEVEYGSVYFEINLEDGTEIIFDLEGNFLCEDDDDEKEMMMTMTREMMTTMTKEMMTTMTMTRR